MIDRPNRYLHLSWREYQRYLRVWCSGVVPLRHKEVPAERMVPFAKKDKSHGIEFPEGRVYGHFC